jgi:hypothetical protein
MKVNFKNLSKNSTKERNIYLMKNIEIWPQGFKFVQTEGISLENILSRVWVTTDGVWVGNSVYWTITEHNYM